MTANARFPVPPGVAATAHITSDSYDELYKLSVEQPEKFWDQQARSLIQWRSLWTKVVSWDFTQANVQWFVGGSSTSVKTASTATFFIEERRSRSCGRGTIRARCGG